MNWKEGLCVVSGVALLSAVAYIVRRIEYGTAEFDSYFTSLLKFIDATSAFPEHDKGNIYGHRARYEKGIRLLERHYRSNHSDFLELGSPYPYYSYYFYEKYNVRTVSADIGIETWSYNQNISFQKLNLCKDEIRGYWDVIILSEVFEHLPCNLYRVRDMIYNHLRPHGLILYSFPTLMVSAEPLDKDLPLDFNKQYGHLREFRNLVTPFLQEYNIVERTNCYPPAYPFAPIEIVLIRKDD